MMKLEDVSNDIQDTALVGVRNSVMMLKAAKEGIISDLKESNVENAAFDQLSVLRDFFQNVEVRNLGNSQEDKDLYCSSLDRLIDVFYSLLDNRRSLRGEASQNLPRDKRQRISHIDSAIEETLTIFSNQYGKSIRVILPEKEELLKQLGLPLTNQRDQQDIDLVFLKFVVASILNTLVQTGYPKTFISQYIAVKKLILQSVLTEVEKSLIKTPQNHDKKRLLETFLHSCVLLLEKELEITSSGVFLLNKSYGKVVFGELFLMILNRVDRFLNFSLIGYFKSSKITKSSIKLINYSNTVQYLKEMHEKFQSFSEFASSFNTISDLPLGYGPFTFNEPEKKLEGIVQKVNDEAQIHLKKFLTFMEGKSDKFGMIKVKSNANVEEYTINYMNLLCDMVNPAYIEGFKTLMLETGKVEYTNYRQILNTFLDQIQKKLEYAAKTSVSGSNISIHLVWLFLLNNFFYIYDNLVTDENFSKHLEKVDFDKRAELLNHSKVIYLDSIVAKFVTETTKLIEKRETQDNLMEHILFVNKWVEQLQKTHSQATIPKKSLRVELESRISEQVMPVYKNIFSKPDLVGSFKHSPQHLEGIISELFSG